jgi:hypothetical protein
MDMRNYCVAVKLLSFEWWRLRVELVGELEWMFVGCCGDFESSFDAVGEVKRLAGEIKSHLEIEISD